MEIPRQTTVDAAQFLENMRVGILTFHLGANYGAYLQAWCLTQAVRELGHDASLINYKNKVLLDSNSLKPWVYRRPFRLLHDFRKYRAFHKAHVHMRLEPFTSDPARVDWNAYDAIVVGSDIVWNCELPYMGQDRSYFGQFQVAYRGRLIAYAPSIGPMNPSYAAPSWVAEGLKKFHSIAVRDANTQQFVENQIGSRPPLVVDPTWLATQTETAQLSYKPRTSREILLVYSFPLKGRMVDEIKSFARKHNLLTVGVGYWQNWCDRNWPDVDPFEWVQLFRQAKYIVSGTFHGTLYAIREQRPFCLLANEGSDNKVSTALAITGLKNRHTSDPAAIERILLQPTDYDAVKTKLEEQRRQSLLQLKQALS